MTFAPDRATALTASYVVVQGPQAALWAGTPSAPHPAPLTVSLLGKRDTPQLALTNEVNLGAKVRHAGGGGGWGAGAKPQKMCQPAWSGVGADAGLLPSIIGGCLPRKPM